MALANVDFTQLQQLPLVPSLAFQTFSTSIAGTTYDFNVYWNTRDAAWYFDMADQLDSQIVSGIKIVLGVSLGRRNTDSRFPPGAFLASNLIDGKTDATLDNLGTGVVVHFWPLAQLQQLAQ